MIFDTFKRKFFPTNKTQFFINKIQLVIKQKIQQAMKEHVNSKVNKRFRIKNKAKNNPEESLDIKSAYLNHVINSNNEIISRAPSKRQYFSVLTTKAQKLPQLQNDKQFSSISFLNMNSELSPSKDVYNLSKQNFKDKSFKIIINEESPRKNECQSTYERGNQSINKDKKNMAHLSYLQYEKLMEQKQIRPTYFDELGKKNDGKYQGNRQQLKRKKIKDLLQTTHSEPPPVKLNKNTRKIKTELSERKTDLSTKTIISCAIGALSNCQIKEKLQDQWEEEQRAKRMNNNNYIFTEESDGSECDKKQYTQTTFQEVNLVGLSNKKQKKQKILNERKEIEWDKIQNINFKEALKKILQIRKHTLNRSVEPQFSKGEEYEAQEERMATVRDVYIPKQFTLKHKLQWRV